MEDKGRIALYGTAAVVCAALAWAGFIRKAEADPGTLVRSAQITLDSVRMMPRIWKGEPNALRRKMLAQAEENLLSAERQVRAALAGGGGVEGWKGEDLACILEFLGYARLLGDDRAGALDYYRKALEQEGCSPERRRSLTFSLARIQLDRGKPREAREWLNTLEPSVLTKADRARWNLMVGEALLKEKAPLPEVRPYIDEACSCSGGDPEVEEACGLFYERAGDAGKGAECLERAGSSRPSALLHLAELKLRQGDAETATSVLLVLGKKAPGLLEAALERKEFRKIARDPRLKALGEEKGRK